MCTKENYLQLKLTVEGIEKLTDEIMARCLDSPLSSNDEHIKSLPTIEESHLPVPPLIHGVF